MWWERSSRIARRSSCGRSHQAADFRIGIKAARVADGLPRLSWRPSKRERSARVTYRSKLVTPVSTQPPIGCCDSSSVTSSRDIQARGRPLTGSTRRTRQDPTLLPTNHVRVANASSPPATTLHCCKLRRLDIANRPVCHSTRTDPSLSADSGRLRNTIYRRSNSWGDCSRGVDDELDCGLVPDRGHGFRATRADAALRASQASPVHDAGWKHGSDPVITADRDGRVYLAWLSFGPTTTEFAGWLVLTRYSNFGATYDFTSVVFAGHDTPSDKLGGPGNSRVTDK